MSNSRSWGILISVAAMVSPAFSQSNPGADTSGNMARHSTGSGNNDAGTPYPAIAGLQHVESNTLTLNGRVLMEDGTPPPPSVVIERVCNGSPHAEGYADIDGYFSIRLGQEAAVPIDASEGESGFSRSFAGLAWSGSGGASNSFANCELRARLGGYHSQAISLLDRNPMDNPDIGVILLHRIGPAEEPTVTATALMAPKAARKALEKGEDLMKKNKPGEAIASLRQAVTVYPRFALAWCELGKLQLGQGRPEEAHESFEAAIKAEPRWPEPYLALSVVLFHAREWQELRHVSEQVAELNSFDYPQAFFFNAFANYSLGHLDAAEKSARSAERIDASHRMPQAAHLLGAILFDRRQYAAAAEELRTYLTYAPRAADVSVVRQQLDAVEKMALLPVETAHK